MNGKGGTRESTSFSVYARSYFLQKKPHQLLHVKIIQSNFAA